MIMNQVNQSSCYDLDPTNLSGAFASNINYGLEMFSGYDRIEYSFVINSDDITIDRNLVT